MYDFRLSCLGYDGWVQAWVKEERHHERYTRRQARELLMVRESIGDLSYWWLEIWHDIDDITSTISYQRRTELHHRILSKMTMEVCLHPTRAKVSKEV